MKKSIKIPEQLFRTASVTLVKRDGAKDGDEEEMSMSISSDEPYQRYDWMNDEDYLEVLDHSPTSIDDARLKSGLPILFNHDRDQHLGRATAFVNDGKKITVSGIKWSESEFAQGKKKDALSGALPDTSVGYRILDEGECIGAKDGMPIYRFKWQPYEGSLVTIPADISVGVARQRAEGGKDKLIEISVRTKETVDTTKKKDTTATTDTMKLTPGVRKFLEADNGGNATTGSGVTVVDEKAVAERTLKSDRERIKKINDFVGALKKPEWKNAAATQAVKSIESGEDFDTFRMNALNSFEGVTQAVQTSELGMSGKELKRYSLAKAILSRCLTGNVSGFEKECSDAQAKLLGRTPDGFYLPEDWTNRSMAEMHGLDSAGISRQLGELQRTLTAGNFTSAGALIGTDLLGGSLIELLRNKTVMLSLGVTSLGGLVGNVAIPRQSGGATAYWLAEGATVTASDQTFQQLGLTPHRMVAQTAYDKQLLAQSSVGVEAIVRGDIALVKALKKDLAIINGSGASGEPLGIFNQASVGTVTLGTTAGTAWAKMLSFETALGVANADQTGTPVFVTTPATRGNLKAVAKIGTTYPVFVMEGDMINGYKVYITNQVPSDKMLFGVPSEIIDATWAGIDVVVNPYSLDSSGQIRTTVMSYHDVTLRHGPAWQVSTDSGALAA